MPIWGKGQDREDKDRTRGVIFERWVPAEARQAYRCDSLAAVLMGVYAGATWPYIALIARRDLVVSDAALSVIVAAPFIGYLFTTLSASQMKGRNKLRAAVWLNAVSVGIFFGTALKLGAWWYVAVVCASSVVAAATQPPYASVIGSVYPEQTRGAILAYVRIGLQVAALAVMYPVGMALDKLAPDGYRIVFPAAALFGGAACLALSRIRYSEDPAEPDPISLRSLVKPFADSYEILRTDPRFRRFIISVFVFGFGNLLGEPLGIVFRADVLRISNSMQGILAACTAAVQIVTYVAWGRHIDRVGPHRVVSMSVFLTAWVWMIYFLAPTAWWLMLAYIVSGLAFAGVQISYLTSILSFAPRDKVPQYQAVHLTSMGIRGTVAPFTWPILLRLMESIFGKGETALRVSFLVPAALILTGFALHRAWVVCGGKEDASTEKQQEIL